VTAVDIHVVLVAEIAFVVLPGVERVVFLLPEKAGTAAPSAVLNSPDTRKIKSIKPTDCQ
jgi:hypothetical protein